MNQTIMNTSSTVGTINMAMQAPTIGLIFGISLIMVFLISLFAYINLKFRNWLYKFFEQWCEFATHGIAATAVLAGVVIDLNIIYIGLTDEKIQTEILAPIMTIVFGGIGFLAIMGLFGAVVSLIFPSKKKVN